MPAVGDRVVYVQPKFETPYMDRRNHPATVTAVRGNDRLDMTVHFDGYGDIDKADVPLNYEGFAQGHWLAPEAETERNAEIDDAIKAARLDSRHADESDEIKSDAQAGGIRRRRASV